MAAELIKELPEHFAVASDIVGYSIPEVCDTDTQNRLASTEWVQPVLFTVSAAHMLHAQRSSPPPDVVAGHSLGEFNALVAAGCLSFEQTLRLVVTRGHLMAQAQAGTMGAVIGLHPDEVASLCGPGVALANINSTQQIVISGDPAAVDEAGKKMKDAGGRFIRLNVSAAFHSEMMNEAADSFATVASSVAMSPPTCEIISNVTGLPYQPHQQADLLASQISSPVQWLNTMDHLLRCGVSDMHEIGPGNVLTKLWSTHREIRQSEPIPQLPQPDHPVTSPARERVRDGSEELGSAAFRDTYGVRLSYATGSMYRGIASTELVAAMANDGLLGFFGTGGLSLAEATEAIQTIKRQIGSRTNFGANVLADAEHPERELALVEMLLREDVRHIEASAFTQMSPALLVFRFKGAELSHRGQASAPRTLLAKVSHPQLAITFASPPDQSLLNHLVERELLTQNEADAARQLSIATDICVEGDSGGHTDGKPLLALLPTIRRLVATASRDHGYAEAVRVGAAGGIGTPEAVAAAYVAGADFVVTGSINQCTVEAGTSDLVKDMLAEMSVHDTAYAPAGDMFELGGRVQVLKRGTMFAARANRLFDLYRTVDSLQHLEPRVRDSLEKTVFRRSLDDVWEDARCHYEGTKRAVILEKAETNGKIKMAMTFKNYFATSTIDALEGNKAERSNFQVHCGPALGAMNTYLAATALEPWRNRRVADLAQRLMTDSHQLVRR